MSSSPGDEQVKPLRRFLEERGWAVRVSTYDRYGGESMSVELSPAPSAAQLDALRREFGSRYDVTTVRAEPHDG